MNSGPHQHPLVQLGGECKQSFGETCERGHLEPLHRLNFLNQEDAPLE